MTHKITKYNKINTTKRCSFFESVIYFTQYVKANKEKKNGVALCGHKLHLNEVFRALLAGVRRLHTS